MSRTETGPRELSILIPAYNEEHRIEKTLQLIFNYIKEKNLAAEVIVIDDGSSDNTVRIVQKYQVHVPTLALIHYKKNRGKGHAVKRGVEASRGQYILFTDADNSTPIEEVEKLFTAVKKGGNYIAIGSRALTRSEIKIRQPWYRRAIGKIGNALIRMLAVRGIHDTQCGFKLFTAKAAQDIFARQRITRFGFDIEALSLAQKLGYRIAEVPVRWINSPQSRFHPVKDTLRTFEELIRIKLNLLLRRY